MLLFEEFGFRGEGVTNRIRMLLVQTPLATQLLFGCPTANFEPLPKGQPLYLDVNQCAFYNFNPKVTIDLAMRFLLTSGQSCFNAEINI